MFVKRGPANGSGGHRDGAAFWCVLGDGRSCVRGGGGARPRCCHEGVFVACPAAAKPFARGRAAREGKTVGRGEICVCSCAVGRNTSGARAAAARARNASTNGGCLFERGRYRTLRPSRQPVQPLVVSTIAYNVGTVTHRLSGGGRRFERPRAPNSRASGFTFDFGKPVSTKSFAVPMRLAGPLAGLPVEPRPPAAV